MKDLEERREEALIDLGAVEVETKGGAVGIEDTGGQQLFAGLSDD